MSLIDSARFQFTHPGGVRLLKNSPYPLTLEFQFTHPGGVRLIPREASSSTPSFNSRTREGCDQKQAEVQGCLRVSIHAPGRGATEFKEATHLGYEFQFTHPGGVRQEHYLASETLAGFQFTHPGGVRPGVRRSVCLLVGLFQFTHPGGVRPFVRPSLDTHVQFQFTHPGGVRRYLYSVWVFRVKVSIHAPGRGATFSLIDSFLYPDVSIHAPGRGATIYIRRCAVLTSCFNSRTREGCDSKLQTLPAYKSQFQFTHPGGVRLPAGVGRSQAEWVSIHAPGRGATCQGTHSY